MTRYYSGWRWIFVGVITGLFWAGSSWQVEAQQSPSLNKEIEAIQQDLQEIKKTLEEIKVKMAETPPVPTLPPPPNEAAPSQKETTVSMDDDPFQGSAAAPVVLIEFSDYQCPFCGRFFKNTYPELDREYIQTGKVKYVFRDYPLPFHQMAPKASEAANCSGDQGKYWEMHDKLFENQTALQVDKLREYAKALGLEMETFNACLDSSKYAGEVQKDLADGQNAGVSGTPTFFLGTSEDGKTIQGKSIVGAQPFASFKRQIEMLLNSAAPPQTPGR